MKFHRDSLVTGIAHQLYKHDLNHSDLVNFFDDEIDWERIAEVAVDYLDELNALELKEDDD